MSKAERRSVTHHTTEVQKKICFLHYCLCHLIRYPVVDLSSCMHQRPDVIQRLFTSFTDNIYIKYIRHCKDLGKYFRKRKNRKDCVRKEREIYEYNCQRSLNFCPLKQVPTGCPETAVRNCHYMLRNTSEGIR